MPYWIHNRWHDANARDVIEQLWTELPEDASPNETPGNTLYWTRLEHGSRPRPNSEREPSIRMFIGLPGETPVDQPNTAAATSGPPTGWVWHTDATFRQPNGQNRRWWVRVPGEGSPVDAGYPGYRNQHGWLRWRQNCWAPADCRQHPSPVPGSWECLHCGLPKGPDDTRHRFRFQSAEHSICDGCRPTVMLRCSECQTDQYSRNVHRRLNFRIGPGQTDTASRDICAPCWNRRTAQGPERAPQECCVCAYYCAGQPVTRNGQYLCQFCVIANASCQHCGTIVRRTNLRRDGTRCDYCSDRVIRSYSDRSANNLGPFGVSKVKTRKGRSFDSTIRFGVELEVEVSETCGTGSEEMAQKVLDKIGEDFAVAKHDGSLQNGFELVTAPAPVSVHRERFGRTLDKRIKGLTCESGRAGMHVHVSRAPLTQLQIGKLLVFMNDVNNKEFIKAAAGRDSNHYSKLIPKSLKGVNQDNGDRYNAINLTNRHTIEFRIFRSSTNLNTVLKNIEFVAACVDWCGGNTGMRKLGWQDFVEYVGTTPSYYPYLVEWMRMKGWLKKPNPIKPPLVDKKPQSKE